MVSTASPPRKEGIEALDYISALMTKYPPPERDATTLAELAQIGVGVGLTVGGAHLSEQAQTAADIGARLGWELGPVMNDIYRFIQAIPNQGWVLPSPLYGDFGTNYIVRAGIARWALAANKPEEATYSAATMDKNLQKLNGSNSYVLHFEPGQAPPNNAFWSITVYTEDGWFITNPQDKYSVGSSNPDLVYQPDGSIDIVFSQEDPNDPNVNWLPVTDGNFQVVLRNYWPQESALDGTWKPPGIEKL